MAEILISQYPFSLTEDSLKRAIVETDEEIIVCVDYLKRNNISDESRELAVDIMNRMEKCKGKLTELS